MQRNVTVFADGEVDRSPCGSGTSARLALLDAREGCRAATPSRTSRSSARSSRAASSRRRGRRAPASSPRSKAPRTERDGTSSRSTPTTRRRGLPPPLARREGGDQLVFLWEAALVLLGEDERSVGENVELALRAFHGSRVVALPCQHDRETRGPAVVAASDGAVEDLDAHDRTLPDRRRAAARAAVDLRVAGVA